MQLCASLETLSPLAAKKMSTVCKGGIAASAFASVMHLLPRPIVLYAPWTVATINDAHAAADIASYRLWLTDGAWCGTFSWKEHVIAAVRTGCFCLPIETVDIIIGMLV